MAGRAAKSNYTMGYSRATTASHSSRTVESDAAFLAPHLGPADRILDVGCGPGTITVGFAAIARQGQVVGIDISDEVLQQARNVAVKAGEPANLSFRQGDVLQGLDWIPDGSFDAVYAGQVFTHIPTAEARERAMAEMRRVLKTGGIMATRTVAALEWYPRELCLDELFNVRTKKAVGTDDYVDTDDYVGHVMPALYRKAGFDKFEVGAGTRVYATPEQRKFLVGSLGGRLAVGETFRKRWMDVGISEQEIDRTRSVLEQWANTEDAWNIFVQADLLGWK